MAENYRRQVKVTLTPALNSIEALYRKLEREQYRAIHARNGIHKADHFFNFCVTAQSMRDFFLERTGHVTRSARAPFHTAWSANPLLRAVAEIANLSKHFQLRDYTGTAKSPHTRRVHRRKGTAVDVYASRKGELKLVPVEIPEITITVSDGTRYDLAEFTIGVRDYWREYLRSNGIRVRRSSLAQLIG